MNDKNVQVLSGLDEAIILNFYRAAVLTKNINLLKEILERSPNLIHPDYRNFDVLTVDNIAQIFIEKGFIIQNIFSSAFFKPECHKHPQNNETESKLLKHVFFIKIHCEWLFYYFRSLVTKNTNLTEIKNFLNKTAAFKGCDNSFPRTTTISYILPDEKFIKKIFRGTNLMSEYLDDLARIEDLNKYNNTVKIAKILLKEGGNVNYVDSYGFTPLLNAIVYKNTELALFLLANGARVDIATREDNYLPLYLAIKHYQGISLVEKIIEKGADLDAQNKFNGYSALHHACSESRTRDCVVLLIRKGADITLKNSAEETPLNVVIRSSGWNNITRLHESSIVINFFKEMVKAKFERRKVNEEDLSIMNSFDDYSYFYERCFNQLSTMKSTIFYPPYSYFDVLNMRNKNIKKLSNLLRNDHFIRNFQANLFSKDLYYEDLMINFTEATIIKNKYDKLMSTLKFAIGNCVPTDLIKYVVDFIEVEDLQSSNED